MPNLPISGLPTASALDGTELLPFVQGGVTTQANVQDILDANLPITSSGIVVSGPIVPSIPSGSSLGTAESPFGDLYVSSGSINIASDVPGDPNTSLSNEGGNILVSAGGMRLVEPGNSFIAETGSFSYLSGSFFHLGSARRVGDTILTGSFVSTGSQILIGTSEITGSLNITGSFTASLQSGYIWVGDSNNKTTTIPTSSFVTSAQTSSLQANWTSTSGSSQILNVVGPNGPTNVSIGKNVGQFTPPSYGVAIGSQAGQSNQGEYGVAIGNGAGQLFQGTNAVAIGSAGYEDQGQYAVAIGAGAGDSGQGQYAIAIGAGAGANHQTANSIILDATNGTIQQAAGAGLHIAPIRSGSNIFNLLSYNTTTKEITYSTQSFAITGSNTFRGTETISGSLVVSGSTIITGSLSINGSYKLSTSYIDGNISASVDLTKQVLVMNDGTWILPDGVEGQIIYFTLDNGGSAEDCYLTVHHLRYNNNGLGTQVISGSWSPFQYGSGQPDFAICTAIFTDGYWAFSGGRLR